MSLSLLAMAALLMLTGAASIALLTSFFRHLSAEQNALKALAQDIAGEDAAIESWGRGYAIRSATEHLAFRADVFTIGELRSGVVDIWRIQLSTRGLPRGTNLIFTNKPAIEGERVVDDVEGRPFERAGWRSNDTVIAAGILSPGALSKSTGKLMRKWRVRGLSIAEDGTLDVSVERDTATRRELTTLLEDVREVKASINQLTPQLPSPSATDQVLVSLGPASGEPVPVSAHTHRSESA